jgi:TonB-linked SusC/RagA family outer membrane protein
MKKTALLCWLLLLFTVQAFAQSRVTGKVTDSKTGTPLSGASITVKGTRTGTSTDAEGNFSIAAAANSVLVISMINYSVREVAVGNSLQLTITLEQQTKELTEVVVTALGVSREKKSLGYSTTTFKSDEINRVAPVSIFDGLQGKIAGADISNVSGSPGGSSKVVLRGFSSLGQTNQPLYIVDGVILSDIRAGSEAIDPDAGNNKGTATTGYDFGNAANDINPGDIESVTILKGAAATSLYGSRATNGVIVITTKKGKSGKLKVDFTTSAIFSDPLVLPKLQEKYGQGWGQLFIPSENGSWGPALDGADRLWGAPVDNSQLIKPFAFVKNNWRDVFEAGREYNNNLTLSGGNDVSTFLLSYGNVYSNGIIPGEGDSYRRNTLSLRSSTKFKGFTAEASLNYVNKSQRFVENGQSASGVGSTFYEQILQIPVDIPIKDFRDYKNKFHNVDNFFTPFASNPYYALFENGSKNQSDRVYGNFNLQYKITNWLTAQLQQGADITNARTKQWRNKNAPSPGSWNNGNNPESSPRGPERGSVQEGAQQYYEYDGKINLIAKKRINPDFNIDGLVGFNYNERGSRVVYTYVEDLVIPGFFDISNAKSKPQSTHAKTRQAIAGLYGSATLGYKNYLYLSVNARNDWSSTLPRGANSYFYPSANLSFLLSNVFDISNKTPINYAKIRVSAGRTGKDALPYQVFDRITSGNVQLPFGQLLFPYQTVPGYTILNQLGNAALQPEISTEYEVGGEFQLFDNRIGIDIAYYNKESDGQILAVPISPSSGYSTQTLNFGLIRNRGIELTAHVMPIRSKHFTWDIGYNFTRNRNKVLQLPAGLEKLVLTGVYNAQLEARLNQPLFSFYAPEPERDPQGRIVVDDAGYPVAPTELGYYGTSQRDFIMGLTNNLTYKNFSLGFSFDYRKGGVFYSSISELLMFTGNHYLTTYNDRKPFIVPNSVVKVVDPVDGKVSYVENTKAIDEANFTNYFYHNSNRAEIYNKRILDKTFLKLRDVTLSYTLPNKIAKKIAAERISITLIGRNLWVWLPKENRMVDPEASNFGRDINSEFGEFRVTPTTRSYGASLRVTF